MINILKNKAVYEKAGQYFAHGLFVSCHFEASFIATTLSSSTICISGKWEPIAVCLKYGNL